MSTISEQVTLLATRIGTECKTIKDNVATIESNIGTLTTLTTDTQTDLVSAINEVDAAVDALTTTVNSIDVSSVIDDETASTSTTYSSSKIEDYVATAVSDAKDDLLGGAGEAYDTLKELADLIETNADAIDALEALAAGHVKYDEAQELTETEQAQARTNIGAVAATTVTVSGDAQLVDSEGVTVTSVTIDGTDLALNIDVTYADAAEQDASGNVITETYATKTELSALESTVSDLSDAVGDSTTDYVALFEAALAGTTEEETE